MIIVRNKVTVNLDQTEISALENAFYKMADFENQLLHGVEENELPVGVKDEMLDYANEIQANIHSFLLIMGLDTTALDEY